MVGLLTSALLSSQMNGLPRLFTVGYDDDDGEQHDPTPADPGCRVDRSRIPRSNWTLPF